VKLFPLTENTTNNHGNDITTEVEVQQTATFHNDETVVTESIIQPLEYNRLLSNSLRETRTHELLDFLARPVLGNVPWSIAQATNTLLLSVKNPSGLIGNAMMTDKMSGFLGFRGTFVMRITLNCQRFMQGRLLLVFVPDAAFIGQDRYNTATSNLVFETQLPRVEVDAASQTEAILKVPFIYPYEAYKLDGSRPQLGDFKLYVYSPLISPTGDTSVPVTYWMHFEDAELLYPTTFTAQSDDVFEAQAMGDSELSASGLPQPSVIFGRINKAATILGKIPLLSSVALPVGWISGILSDAASALGFSNPRLASPASRMLMQKTPYINNVNAIDNSLSYGFFSDNSVELLPGAMGTDIDEMSLVSIAMRPAYFARFNWVDTDNPGTLLFSLNTDPNVVRQSITVSDGTVNHTVFLPTPCSYLRNFFRQWRGSLCFTLKFVKTEFHSGRLVVAWFPGLTTAPASLTGSEQIYKEVVDVRLNNEFEFCIPYVAIQPWMETFTGVFGIYVLNPLRAPSTCSQTIDVLIEGAMGGDAAFALQRQSGVNPILGTFTAQFDDVWEAQSLNLNDTHCSQVTVGATAMGSKPDDNAITAARFCTGELITSLRQVLKRSTIWNSLTYATDVTLAIWPFTVHHPLVVAGSPFTAPTHYADYYSAFVTLFAYNRGGVRLKFWDQLGAAVTMSARHIAELSSGTNFTTGVFGGNVTYSNATFINVAQTGALEVEAPQYTLTKMRGSFVSTGLTVPSPVDASPRGKLEFTWHTTTPSSTLIVYRQIADDFNCGFFLGAIPLTAYVTYGNGVWG